MSPACRAQHPAPPAHPAHPQRPIAGPSWSAPRICCRSSSARYPAGASGIGAPPCSSSRIRLPETICSPPLPQCSGDWTGVQKVPGS